MASPTNKVDKIRKNKRTAIGQRRKREIRREIRRKIAGVSEALGLGPGALKNAATESRE